MLIIANLAEGNYLKDTKIKTLIHLNKSEEFYNDKKSKIIQKQIETEDDTHPILLNLNFTKNNLGSKPSTKSLPPPPDPQPQPPLTNRGTYFDWERGNDGWGHCYEWTTHREVLNNGNPIEDFFCEENYPSHFRWDKGLDGWGYCYQYSPNGYVLNYGAPIPNNYCEATSPSFYNWGRGYDGYTHCYQYTFNGIIMNQGSQVNESYCRN
jgi:hypothetical protein